MKRPQPFKGFKKYVKRRPAISEVVREPTAGGVVFRRGKQDEIEILLIQDATFSNFFTNCCFFDGSVYARNTRITLGK